MKKIDFNKLLKSVLLILAIILMFLKISASASADSYLSVSDYVEDFNFVLFTQLNNVSDFDFSEFPYVMSFDMIDSFSNHYQAVLLSPFIDLDFCGCFGGANADSAWFSLPRYKSLTGYDPRILSFTQYDAPFSFYYAISLGSDYTIYRYDVRIPYGEVENNMYFYSAIQSIVVSSSSPITFEFLARSSYLYTNANFNLYYLVRSGNYWVYNNYTLFFDILPLVINGYVYSDIPVSKIILSSSLNDTQYALRVRLDDFASFSAAVSNQPSILVTVNVSGSEISKTFTYESSYYHFNLAASSCYFDIPLSEFGIDQGTDYSFLTDIKLDMVISSPGGSSTYMYQDSYNFALVGSIPQAIISPTVVPMPTLTPAVVKSDQEIINIYNQLKQAGNNNGFNISFNDSITNYTFPEWVNQIEITIRQVYDAGGVSYKYQSAITSYSQYNQDFCVVHSPSDYIFMNFASQFYDVCIINLDVYAYTGTIISGSDLPVLQSSQGSVILFSDRYFNHQQAITSLDLLSAVQNLSFNSSLFFNFMNDKLSAFEGSVINGFNSLIGLDNVIIQRLDYGLFEIKDNIDSNSGRIVSAIENIDFPSTGGSSYSLPALSEQLQLLFIPSLQWEQINYNDYLDSLGVLALPFEFTFDVQSVVKSNYSSNMALEINELNVPLGSDNLVLFSDMEQFNFDPKSIFPNQLWQIFQYLAAFALVAGEAWFTYCHIFRKEDKS